MKLTKAQEKILAEVKAGRVKPYDGRSAKPIQGLVDAGLVTVEESIMQSIYSNWVHTRLLRVRLKDES